MENKLAKPGRIFAYKQSAFVTSIVLVVTLIFLNWGVESAKSALVGGLIGVIPNLLFAYKAFRYAGATASRKVVDSFFSGVKQKMVLTAFLFVLAFKFVTIIPFPFFGTYCLVMALPLVTPFVIKEKR